MTEVSSTPKTKRARRVKDDPPDSSRSVGWVEAKTIKLATAREPFTLEVGAKLGPVVVEYETYGRLSKARDNVVLVAHALSGDAHAAGWDKNAQHTGRLFRTRNAGWWDSAIGPGKPIDTDRFFVICSNVLGSCYGTTGPASINPATGKPYGLSFPVVTVGDWVRVQAKMLDAMGIERIRCVVGGSLGGQQALEWALAYPDRVERSIVLAAARRLSTQGLAFDAVGRQAITSDPNFKNGDYYGGPPPAQGLAVARMMAHITYLSEEGMHEKFGRRLQDKEKPDFSLTDVEFEIESYLAYQGRAFVERFDANSYLYITRALDYYDAATWGGGDLVEACRRLKSKMMVVSFSSDWLFTPAQCREFASAMCRSGKSMTYVEVPSRYGHDSFLVETGPVGHLLRHFIDGRPR